MIVFSRDHSRSLRDRAEMITVSIRRNRTIGRPLPGHGFPKPGGPQRTPEDTRYWQFEYRRTPEDPRAHSRTRVYAGSGP